MADSVRSSSMTPHRSKGSSTRNSKDRISETIVVSGVVSATISGQLCRLIRPLIFSDLGETRFRPAVSGSLRPGQPLRSFGTIEPGLFNVLLKWISFRRVRWPVLLTLIRSRCPGLQSGHGAVEFGAIRTIVDLEQECSFTDQIAIFEKILIEIAADPSANFNGLDSDGLSGKLLELGHQFFVGLLDKDFRRLGNRLFRLFIPATRNRDNSDNKGLDRRVPSIGNPEAVVDRRGAGFRVTSRFLEIWS